MTSSRSTSRVRDKRRLNRTFAQGPKDPPPTNLVASTCRMSRLMSKRLGLLLETSEIYIMFPKWKPLSRFASNTTPSGP